MTTTIENLFEICERYCKEKHGVNMILKIFVN